MSSIAVYNSRLNVVYQNFHVLSSTKEAAIV